jgi:hypothetical protein
MFYLHRSMYLCIWSYCIGALSTDPSRFTLTFGCHILVEFWLHMRSSIVIDMKVEQSIYVLVTYMGEKTSEVHAERPAFQSSTCSHRDLKVRWIGHEFRSRGTIRLAIVPALNARARTNYSYSICIKGINLSRTRSTSGRGSGSPLTRSFAGSKPLTLALY